MDGSSKVYINSVQTEKPLKIHYKIVDGVKIKMNDFEEKLFNCMVMIKRADEIAYHPTEMKIKRMEKGNSDFDKYLKKKSIEAAKKTKFQYSRRKIKENKTPTINSTPKRKYVKKSFQDKHLTDNFQKNYHNSVSLNWNNAPTSSPTIFGTKTNETFHRSQFNFLDDEKLRKRVEVQLRNIALMKEYRKYFKEHGEEKQSQSPTYCRKARSLCDMKNISNSTAVFKNETEKNHFAKKEQKRNGPKVLESGKVTTRRRSDSDTICNYDHTSSASKLFIQVFKKAVENEKSTKTGIEVIPFQPRDQHFLSQSPFELPEKLLCDDATPEKLDENGPNISFELGESSKYSNKNKAEHMNLRETLPTDDEYIHKSSETLPAEILEENNRYDQEACCSLFPNNLQERRDTRVCGAYESFLLPTKSSSRATSTVVSGEFIAGNIPLSSRNYIEPNEIEFQNDGNLGSEDQRKQNCGQNINQQNQTTTHSSDTIENANLSAMVGTSTSSTTEIINTINSDNEVSSTTQQIGRVRTRRKTVASGWNEIRSVDAAVTNTQKKRKMNEPDTEINGSVRDNAPTTTTTIVKPIRRRRKSKGMKNKAKQLELSHTDTETEEHASTPVILDQQRLTEMNIPSNPRKRSDEEKHIGDSETVTNPCSIQSINLEVNRNLSESPEDLNVNANIRQTYSKNSFIQNVFVPPDVEQIIELSQNNMRQQNEEVKAKKSIRGKSRRKKEFKY